MESKKYLFPGNFPAIHVRELFEEKTVHC
jgi:hypothetical protein